MDLEGMAPRLEGEIGDPYRSSKGQWIGLCIYARGGHSACFYGTPMPRVSGVKCFPNGAKKES